MVAVCVKRFQGKMRLLVLPALLLLCCSATAQQSNQAVFFLPKNPIAAAYVLGRLSNHELIAAPRGEFVYVALLQRKGLERKYRMEALEGLAAIRKTNALEQLLKGIDDLDKKGDESEATLRDLAAILLQSGRADLVSRSEELRKLALQAQLSITRQIGWAAGIAGEGAADPVWRIAESNPAQLEDLVLGLALLPDAALREAFYPKVKLLLRAEEPPALIRAAATAIISLPGHDTETFRCLGSLAAANVQTSVVIESLARLPRGAWPKEGIEPLSQSVLAHLRSVPPEQRAEPVFAEALQFATELASLLQPEAGRTLIRAIRSLGPTVVTLHAIYEQMRFDKDRIVAEPGKPLVIFLQNDDAMPHNLAVLAPGSLQEIGLAAEKMPPEADSEGRLYVPASPKVLHATRLAGAGQKIQLAFEAPAEPGEYPFLCTFPGHWLRMSGTLTIVPDAEAYLANHPITSQPTLTEWKLADFASALVEAAPGASPAAGRELFSKLACLQCHKLGASGYSYGPDLTEVVKRYKNDRAAVLQQILEPSIIIEERYRNFNFELKDGDSVLGMILKEDDESVTIQTGPADSLIQVLRKSQIQRRRAQASSPMPVGLLNALSKSQVFDLLAYLESGGDVPVHDHSH
jgi:putative heme-binding domain-containing protein